MAPIELLILTLAITAAAGGAFYLTRLGQVQALRALAREWKMNFVRFDRFRLAARTQELFPVRGAADLRVMDVIYGRAEERYRYIFTVEYTEGVLRTKHRRSRVCALTEPRHPVETEAPEFVAGEAGVELLNDYRRLGAAIGAVPPQAVEVRAPQ